MSRLSHIVLPLALLALSACEGSDPERDRFVALCTAKGDTEALCDCTFRALEIEIGEVDASVVDFVADFAKWNADLAANDLDKEAILDKHQLTEEDYRLLAEQVGGAMLKGFNQCSGLE
jgi:hypothetical protein